MIDNFALCAHSTNTLAWVFTKTSANTQLCKVIDSTYIILILTLHKQIERDNPHFLHKKEVGILEGLQCDAAYKRIKQFETFHSLVQLRQGLVWPAIF
jgi:hypothetical protein